jgi:hypothetical protein
MRLKLILALAALPGFILPFASAMAQSPDYVSWPLLQNPFESTGGGGVMIDGYKPVVTGNRCTTDFSVRMPDGATFQNEVVFDASVTQGGTLCANGRWRAKDGSASGTTPFEMFIKEGIVRRKP